MTAANAPDFDVFEQKHQLEQLASHIPMAAAILDRDMRYVFANDRWIADFELHDIPLIGTQHRAVFDAISADWPAVFARCLQGAIQQDEYIPYTQANGSLVRVSYEARPWQTSQGDTGGVIVYAECTPDREETHDELIAQRNFLQQMIDLDPSFIFAKDADGRFVLVNKALADAYGSTPDEMVGKLDEDFNPIRTEAEHFHHDDLDVIQTCQPKFIAEEPLSNAVTGETRWYQTIKVPLIAPDGETVQLLGVATDITDRKKTEDALKEQRNFLRQVIDLDPSFIFAKDADGRFMLVNKALADTYGSTPDEMVGKLDEDFNPIRTEAEHFHRDDLDVIQTCQPKFIAEEPLSNAVTGETRWYQTIKVPLFAPDGETVQLLGVATDITDRKQALDRFKTQRNFLRQVIDLDPSFIFAKDQEGRFVLVNKALADAYATTPEDMVGKYDEDFNSIQGETRQFRQDDNDVIHTRQPKFIPEEPVTHALTGETRWYQTTKVPLIPEGDNNVQLLGIATDITERKHAQEKLQELVIHEQKARREAETATKLKDLFLANMSHELRTPLNAIIGFLREMMYSEQLDADNTHMAERCLANGQRLLMLINSVLDLSRLATGSLEIVLSDISLPTLTATIIEDLGLQAKDKGLELALDLDPQLPEVVTHDEERLIQIMTNLIANAIKFTDEGIVTLALENQADRLIIRVSDTGIGIPNTMQSHIFQDFVQLDGSSKRRYGGAGLGLSIVSNLVDLMEGQVTVKSEVGEFSIFTVNIPLDLGVIDSPL